MTDLGKRASTEQLQFVPPAFSCIFILGLSSIRQAGRPSQVRQHHLCSPVMSCVLQTLWSYPSFHSFFLHASWFHHAILYQWLALTMLQNERLDTASSIEGCRCFMAHVLTPTTYFICLAVLFTGFFTVGVPCQTAPRPIGMGVCTAGLLCVKGGRLMCRPKFDWETRILL